MCREQLGTSWRRNKNHVPLPPKYVMPPHFYSISIPQLGFMAVKFGAYPQNTRCYHISTAFLYHNWDSWGLNLECCAAAVVAAVRFPCVYCLFNVSVLKQRETIRDSTVL
jgi:hypothetical protein